MTEFERGVMVMFYELQRKAKPGGKYLTGALVGDDVGKALLGHAIAARDVVLSKPSLESSTENGK